MAFQFSLTGSKEEVERRIKEHEARGFKCIACKPYMTIRQDFASRPGRHAKSRRSYSFRETIENEKYVAVMRKEGGKDEK